MFKRERKNSQYSRTNIVRKGAGLLFAAIEKQKGRLDCAYEGGDLMI